MLSLCFHSCILEHVLFESFGPIEFVEEAVLVKRREIDFIKEHFI